MTACPLDLLRFANDLCFLSRSRSLVAQDGWRQIGLRAFDDGLAVVGVAGDLELASIEPHAEFLLGHVRDKLPPAGVGRRGASASAAPQGSCFGGLIWRNVGLRNLLESRLRGASKHRNSPAGCKRRTRTKENRYGQSKRHH
jgi:hypothetical protein